MSMRRLLLTLEPPIVLVLSRQVQSKGFQAKIQKSRFFVFVKWTFSFSSVWSRSDISQLWAFELGLLKTSIYNIKGDYRQSLPIAEGIAFERSGFAEADALLLALEFGVGGNDFLYRRRQEFGR